MKREKIVVALGGNALGKTPSEQKQLVKHTAKTIVDLIEAGKEVILSHGNGPQVGMINLAMSVASQENSTVPEMPFPECGAMSQGYIGYHLQNAIGEELKVRGIKKPIATVVTQVVVDKNDPAFNHPTKPIGSFYTKEEADQIASQKGYTMKEDSGRGYRRVVASPLPIDVEEKDSISLLVENQHLVIAVGGGGIPVYREGNSLVGVPAVIDKDFASAKLAEIVDADMLIILTAVDKVAINFGTENQQNLSNITLDECEKYIDENQFGEGSMLPKIKAAMSFVASKKGRKCLITSLENAGEGIKGENGTLVSAL